MPPATTPLVLNRFLFPRKLSMHTLFYLNNPYKKQQEFLRTAERGDVLRLITADACNKLALKKKNKKNQKNKQETV